MSKSTPIDVEEKLQKFKSTSDKDLDEKGQKALKLIWETKEEYLEALEYILRIDPESKQSSLVLEKLNDLKILESKVR